MAPKGNFLTQRHINQCPACFYKTDDRDSSEDSVEPLIDDTPVGQLAYSISDAVVATGIGRSSLYVEIKEGRLRASKCGRRTIILKYDLLDWLASLPEAG